MAKVFEPDTNELPSPLPLMHNPDGVEVAVEEVALVVVVVVETLEGTIAAMTLAFTDPEDTASFM